MPTEGTHKGSGTSKRCKFRPLQELLEMCWSVTKFEDIELVVFFNVIKWMYSHKKHHKTLYNKVEVTNQLDSFSSIKKNY